VKRIPNFNQFLTESSINETVYNSGLGGDLVYSKTGDSSIKRKTIGILKSKKWMKTQVGKNMLDEADRLANMWKERNPSTWPIHFKDYKKDADGFVKPSNFIKATGLIVCVLDEISKRENATWVDAKLRRGHCFGNATEWAFKNEAKTIGGIIIETGNLNILSTESLVVHAFCEKGNNYYEVTIPTPGRTAEVIYWPLITYSNPNEMKVAEETWSYALGIEEGANEYLNSL
jgi:hypothetical protein